MKSKHKFVPSQVVPMEERALLSSVELSLTIYKDVLLAATRDIQVFEANVINTFNKDNIAGVPTAAFFTTVGIGTLGTGPNFWSYGSGTLLAALDTKMGAIEFHMPWGGAEGKNPTGGLGLSDKTALTTLNPQSQGLWNYYDFVGTPPTEANGTVLPNGVSVAENMELTLEEDAGIPAAPLMTTAAALTSDMNAVLTQTVSTHPTGAPVFFGFPTNGVIPGYIDAFGPTGEKFFKLER